MRPPRREIADLLTGLHLLLTYQCNLECDHCFVWGGPRQTGTMTLANVKEILRQARGLGTISWIYFEGGEPFLYYGLLLASVRRAARMGFKVGIVSNGYWATTREDGIEWLRPFRGRIQDLSISGDPYHGTGDLARLTDHATAAAERLGIPAGVIRIAPPETESATSSLGQLAPGESALMFRGRAAQNLASRVRSHPWYEFTTCPHEKLRDPERIHVDPLGNVHLCQGISLGNLFRTPLRDLLSSYRPDDDPIVGPLLRGGPAELVRVYHVLHSDGYADACHLCDSARRALRTRFPGILTPDQAYGILPK